MGLYTSPHLVDFRERIRVNGEMIPKEAVVEFVNRFRSCGYEGHPSFFELTMMMAFDWFAKAEVDYAVIEVGMGGRLDSTNIITPIGCVITNISKDHTQFLGDTLEKIAGEKAGIIKKGIPVVIGEAEGAVKEVFASKAGEVGAPIAFAEESGLLTDVSDLNRVKGADGSIYCYDLKGDYQRKNIRTVFSAVEMLRSAGVKISPEALKEGVENVSRLTGLAGRWMQLQEDPLVIADTGHNEAGLKYNMNQLSQLLPRGARLHMVVGFVNDKDVDHILPLFPADALYYVTQAQIPRAMPAEVLAGKCAGQGFALRLFPQVSDAYKAALEAAAPQDIIYVGGSTFVVADLLANLPK